MDHLIGEISRALSPADIAGLVMVLGLALYGLTGPADGDGFDGAGGDGD